jgi:cell division protein FtsB
MFLAGVDSFREAESYVDSHQDNTKVSDLIDDIGRLRDSVTMLTAKVENLQSSISILESYVDRLTIT